jgi:hypothetical protein
MRNCRLLSRVSFENSPCFQFALCERAKPSGVFGPVLTPPCIRQRPFRIAGARHSDQLLVFAPHLGDRLGSPGGLPFLSHPRRFAWGSFVFFCISEAFVKLFMRAYRIVLRTALMLFGPWQRMGRCSSTIGS